MDATSSGPVASKRCKGPCGEMKPLEDFYVHRTARDGRRSACRDCWADATRRRREAKTVWPPEGAGVPDLPGETWRPIPGFAGYEASTVGRLRGVHRLDSGGRRRKGVILKGIPADKGHLRVTLWRSGQPHQFFIHQLILLTFAGPPGPGEICRHGPAGVSDNSLANLCYGSPWDNMHDKLRDGTQLMGEQQWNARLTDERVREARALYAAGGVTQAVLAARYGVSTRTMGKALRGERWAHVGNAQPASLRPTLNAKLTDDDVREIRRLHAASGVSYRQLGQRFGVTCGAVREVVKGRRRSNVA